MDIFKDLVVVELASVLAGPAVGLFFRELGATVIKIENKVTGGDVTRRWKLPSENKELSYSAYYCSVNWKKETHFLDLTKEEDQRIAYEFIQKADVVISNFRPASARKLGMSYEQLKTVHPGLIFGLITGYGEDNPLPAFDVVMQAETGFLYMCGTPDGPSVKMPVALIDLLAAHQLKEGILTALIQKLKTGKGSKVSVSLYDAAVASLANQATNWLMAGHIPQKMGTQHPNIAPYGDIFHTTDDKQILLAIGTDRQFRQLCSVLGAESISSQEAFATNAARVQNRLALVDLLKKAFNTVDSSILERLKENGIPCAEIKDMKQVFEDEKTGDLILEEDVEGAVTRRVRSVVFKMD